MYLHSMIFTGIYFCFSEFLFYACVGSLSREERYKAWKEVMKFGFGGFIVSLIHTFAASRLVYRFEIIHENIFFRGLVELSCFVWCVIAGMFICAISMLLRDYYPLFFSKISGTILSSGVKLGKSIEKNGKKVRIGIKNQVKRDKLR